MMAHTERNYVDFSKARALRHDAGSMAPGDERMEVLAVVPRHGLLLTSSR